MFNSHYEERLPEGIVNIISGIDLDSRRESMLASLGRNKFVKDDKPIAASVMPRVFPSFYKEPVHDACRLLTRLILDTLYDRERSSSLNGSDMAKMLREDGILDHLPGGLFGSARYDLAVVGEPASDNPPKLIEFNLVDYGGMGWTPRLHKAFLDVVPELSHAVEDDKTVFSMARNFARMGDRFLMVMEGETTYEDYDLFREEIERYGITMDIVSLDDFDNVQLSDSGVVYKGRRYCALYLKALSMEDEIAQYRPHVRRIIQSGVPVYETLGELLLEDKGAIGVLADGRALDSREAELVRKVIPQNLGLDDRLMDKLRRRPQHFVLKKRTAHMGEAVYVGGDMLAVLDTITDLAEWCVQAKYKLNRMDAVSTNGERGNAIVDLAVFVNFAYDARLPEPARLKHFDVGGLMSRGSQTSHLVNISQGGFFVPTYFANG